ncbi:3'-5'-bisphosphate nucleotidase [Pseudoalteromonas luteoviolacea CPMOR-2]|uniref:3'(2'),5'-bisphosphate nucleotidase CysQ n=1 Tax=Pseudoalteromonas luteoviolacea DSM 6061 TaxID=1365250 RepID=A0A161ZVR8_9GAMM|nr:3'(2'),5'-bisphosphate nucleotidase CysQ [Pseudoalteromonas luteoviolacea]KZN35337.1 3'-5'-bisphosphate nucleotidase [Pseudoalteromonas luteoviolacea DSM 6061]KZN53458.1 3'-5'-bisphosphate nucleotidase [Pseudoalteromonas luteoviolacea CPMOR-2]MBE0387581.1 3'(2'), 5'-bisphosphate nucleotidase [Pseudoalteromonas luteoviolacea DSM 6061]
MNDTDLLEELVELARLAGEEIMQIYAKDFAVDYKNDNSPVTDADLAANCVITAGLKRLTPEIPILSEESADISWQERQSWQRYWLVDPIDGTKEFIKKNGEFTVNIALIEHGNPTMGVVYAPALKTCYLAAKSIGAFRECDEARIELKVTRKSKQGKVKVVGSRSHPSPELEDYLAQFDDVEMVPKGSSLKLCLVAEGEADIYPRLGPTSEWDTGAGHAVAEIAGATVTHIDGSPLKYNQKESFLNPYFVVSRLES